jgi:hypothetical protein
MRSVDEVKVVPDYQQFFWFGLVLQSTKETVLDPKKRLSKYIVFSSLW